MTLSLVSYNEQLCCVMHDEDKCPCRQHRFRLKIEDYYLRKTKYLFVVDIAKKLFFNRSSIWQ